MEASELCLLSGPWCWVETDWGAYTPETWRRKTGSSHYIENLWRLYAHTSCQTVSGLQSVLRFSWADSLEISCDATFHFSNRVVSLFLLPLLSPYNHILLLQKYSTEWQSLCFDILHNKLWISSYGKSTAVLQSRKESEVKRFKAIALAIFSPKCRHLFCSCQFVPNKESNLISLSWYSDLIKPCVL